MTQNLSVQGARPAFLSTAVNPGDLGTEGMGAFITPPRLKVIQPTSKGIYAEKFSPGDVLLTPQNLKVTGLTIDPATGRAGSHSPEVLFTPLFWFVEYCAWNPLERGNLPMIREQSYDPKSQIAVLARNYQTRSAPCPEVAGKFISYVEHINFIVLIHSEELSSMPVVMSFSKAEHKTGTNFMHMLQMRKAPIYGTKFVFNSQYRENPKGRWYGMDVNNPPPAISAWVEDPAQFELAKSQFEMLKAAHADRAIVVDHSSAEDEVLGEVLNSDMS